MPTTESVNWRASFAVEEGDPLPAYQTPLREKLTETDMDMLAQYVRLRVQNYFSGLHTWRQEMERFEKRMEDCMEDRVSKLPGGDNLETFRAIFEKCNETLNVVGGFADFAFSQARNDLFGSEPFISAKPVGRSDKKLADTINKHANWKLGKTNVARGMEEALYLAFHLGTAFPKTTWRRSEETYERDAMILVDPDGEPITRLDGSFYFMEDAEGPEDGAEIPEGAKFQRKRVEEKVLYFDNAETFCIDFHDVAWDMTAKEFDLDHTPIFHKYKGRLHDIAAQYDLDEETVEELRGVANDDLKETVTGTSSGDDPRRHRGEETPTGPLDEADQTIGNPRVQLVECYLRLDILRNGNPLRVFAVYCPAMERILFVNYLAEVTPNGDLPIKPVRIYRIPGRAYGRGFHERYENVQDYIDSQFNAASYNNALNRNPPGGYDKTQLDEDLEDEDGKLVIDPNKVWKLKPNGDMKKFLQFADPPPDSDRSIELAGLMIEMAQLRTGISSAAQGELSSLPQANTATGIRQLMSRSATLLKWPIDNAEKDLTHTAQYAVTLLYANHNAAETFAWGEGENREILELGPADVQGLSVDVVFEMVQAQNEARLESVQTAMTFMQAYVNLPELEKRSARSLAIDAMRILGIHDPESVIRQPILTFEDLLRQIPPEIQQLLVQNSQYHAQQVMEAEGQQGPPSTQTEG